jgi:hypothetical protein
MNDADSTHRAAEFLLRWAETHEEDPVMALAILVSDRGMAVSVRVPGALNASDTEIKALIDEVESVIVKHLRGMGVVKIDSTKAVQA